MLGPSGCGKTSTLRLIAGFEKLDCGRDPARRRRHVGASRRTSGRVNTVFQSYALFPHMTVAENVAFGLRYQKCRQGRDRAARRRGDGAGPARRAGARGGRRSSRAASSSAWRWRGRSCSSRRCCCSTSRWARLDARLRVDLQVELKRIQETLGITFVYVTHDQDEALTMSDRVAVMQRRARRAVRRAARALRGAGDGVRGQLPRRLEPDPGAGVGRWRSRSASSRCAANVDGPHGRGAGDDPARARAAGAARLGGENRVPGMVEAVVYLGFHQDVRVRLASGALVRCDVPNDGSALEHSSGDPVCVHLPADCLRVLEGRVRRREELVTAARRVIGRDGFAARDRRRRSRARRALRSGCLNYHFGSKDEVVAEAFAAAAREDLAALEAISRRHEDPAERLAAYLDQSEWADADSLAAVGRRVGRVGAFAAGARHARALRRRLARGAGRGARGRRAPGALGVRRPAGHRGAAGRRARRDRPAHDRPRRGRPAGARDRAGRAGSPSSSSA